jgi:hypothetical protein
MIFPTDSDIGRKVLYVKYETRDIGVIESVTEFYVFVRYGKDLAPKGTLRQDLQWYDECSL